MAKLTILNEKTYDVESGTSFCEFAEAHPETSLMFGCRSASCGTCLIRVLAGSENLSPMQTAERDFLEVIAAEPDERLACQTAILGDVMIAVSE